MELIHHLEENLNSEVPLFPLKDPNSVWPWVPLGAFSHSFWSLVTSFELYNRDSHSK